MKISNTEFYECPYGKRKIVPRKQNDRETDGQTDNKRLFCVDV